MVVLPTTIVELTLTVAGDLTDFLGDADLGSGTDIKSQPISPLDALEKKLRTVLSCDEPYCHIRVEATAASVSLDVRLTIPGDDSGQGSIVAQRVSVAATTFGAQALTDISASLGVLVIAITPVHVARGVPSC